MVKRKIVIRVYLLLLCFSSLLHADHLIVATFSEFEGALSAVVPGDTILVQDGIYHNQSTWSLQVRTDHVTIKGLSGIRENVVIRGRGMHTDQHHGFWVDADHVTIQDLTIQNVRNHCIQTHLDTDFLHVKNCVLRDAGEQMLKVPGADMSGSPSDSGLVEDCLFEYSAGIGPRYYIGGIDCHYARDWIVRRNVFRGIASPEETVAEHAVHFWSWSENTLCENNLILNCDRGIGYGLSNSGHRNGIIRNNIIYHDETAGGGFADVSIEVFYSDNAAIYNNTIYQEHSNYFAGIKNWGGDNVSIINNVVNVSDKFYGHLKQAIWVTANGDGPVSHNYVSVPAAELFSSVEPPDANRVEEVVTFLHIREKNVELVDAGTENIPGLPAPFYDFDGHVRPIGGAIDIGADEYEECVEVGRRNSNKAMNFRLYQNYPNPFNSQTFLKFDLVSDARVELKVYDALGRMVASLSNDIFPAGIHRIAWKTGQLPSGFYFLNMRTMNFEQSVKACLLK